jgi:hypothetical protein
MVVAAGTYVTIVVAQRQATVVVSVELLQPSSMVSESVYVPGDLQLNFARPAVLVGRVQPSPRQLSGGWKLLMSFHPQGHETTFQVSVLVLLQIAAGPIGGTVASDGL